MIQTAVLDPRELVESPSRWVIFYFNDHFDLQNKIEHTPTLDLGNFSHILPGLGPSFPELIAHNHLCAWGDRVS